MVTVTWFDTREELRELTGLPGDNHDKALWNAGFNLDDWDFGFVSDEEWTVLGSERFFKFWLMLKMGNHCAGYQHTEYNGRHYYMAYHS